MGLFTKKERPKKLRQLCCVCEKELGSYKLKDGTEICTVCHYNAEFDSFTPVQNMTRENVIKAHEKVAAKQEEMSKFVATKVVKTTERTFLKIDDNNKKWYIPISNEKYTPIIHSFSEVIDYELLEDGNSVVKGGVGSVVVGGLLFGGIGAIVGSNTGSKKSKATCTSLKLKITLNDMKNPVTYINFITKETKKDFAFYKITAAAAQECVSLFNLICESSRASMQQTHEQTTSQSISVADEIKKFKELLDIGAITQEEFDNKKKQLLSL